ncbi:hypothetical protein ACFL0D_04480 [Thermoproteota archaeon]
MRLPSISHEGKGITLVSKPTYYGYIFEDYIVDKFMNFVWPDGKQFGFLFYFDLDAEYFFLDTYLIEK